MSISFIISTMLFFIGSLGVFLSRKNLILSIMSLELMLLSVYINFIFFSIYTDTILGQISTFFIFYYFLFYTYFNTFGIIQFYKYIYLNINKKILFFNRLIINSLLYVFFIESYKSTYKLIDKNIFEIIGPFGIIFNLKFLLKNVFKITTGLIYHYSGIIIISVICANLLILNIFFFFI